jgi:hypothetical protein
MLEPEIPKKPAAFLVKMKFTFGIWPREALNKLRVPTTEPAAAFVEIVRLLMPIIDFLRYQNDHIITSIYVIVNAYKATHLRAGMGGTDEADGLSSKLL